MPNTYNNSFSFNPKDIELIEQGLRMLSKHYNLLADLKSGASPGSESVKKKDYKLKQINEVLGKIHNQKIFYSQTHPHKGVPLG